MKPLVTGGLHWYCQIVWDVGLREGAW